MQPLTVETLLEERVFKYCRRYVLNEVSSVERSSFMKLTEPLVCLIFGLSLIKIRSTDYLLLGLIQETESLLPGETCQSADIT